MPIENDPIKGEESEQQSRLGVAIAEYLLATDSQQEFDVQAWLDRHADIAEPLQAFIANQSEFHQLLCSSTNSSTARASLALTPNAPASEGTKAACLSLAQRRFGPYEVLHEIGRGGMGVVYAARDTQLHRTVALKVLRYGSLSSEEDRRRFRLEAEAVARLDHSAIIPIYEVGTWEGAAYFTMKLVNGGTLRDWIEVEDMHSIQDIVRCMREVACALQHAHERGVLHRDLKPANILLDFQGHPIVADFGLAKQFDSAETTAGRMMGTPAYMAPEQVVGTSTTASEVYAIGAILYALLTKRPPYLGNTLADQIRQLESCSLVSPRQLNSQVPRDLETICLKCLRKTPTERYSSAAAVAADLFAFLENRPILARPVSRLEALIKVLQRNTATSLAYALLLIVVIFGVGGTLALREDARRTRVEQLKNLAATGLASAIASADLAQMTNLLDWPPDDHPRVLMALREHWFNLSLETSEELISEEHAQAKRLNLALALVADDPAMADHIWPALLRASPMQLPTIGKRLDQSLVNFSQKCVRALESEDLAATEKIRLAGILAATQGRFVFSSGIDRVIVEQLLDMSPREFGEWSDLLRPGLDDLSACLQSVYEHSEATEQQRLYAVDLLTQVFAGQTDKLFELIQQARPAEFALIKRRLGNQLDAVVALAETRLRLSVSELPTETEEIRRLSRVGILLAHHGRFEWLVEPMMNVRDPRLCSQVVYDLPRYGVPVDKVWAFTTVQQNAVLRFSLLSCLAGYPAKQWPPALLEEATTLLKEWYIHDSDPGIHAICSLILRRLYDSHDKPLPPIASKLPPALQSRPEQEIQRAEAGEVECKWFVNHQNQTFVIVDAGEFIMGSPEAETDRDSDEQQHRRLIDRRFAIAATEVTRRDFLKFRPDFPYFGQGDPNDLERPLSGIDWYTAASYCNWLSEQEGIPRQQWCYEPNADGQYAAGMRLVRDSLNRVGYRLPTESEWEFACRAGSITSRYYGDSEELLASYAWYSPIAKDHSHPVAKLLPNRLGLFDPLGNVYEWCHDLHTRYPPPLEAGTPETVTLEDSQLASCADYLSEEQSTDDTQRRCLRGGSFDYSARHCRSAYRTNDLLDFVVSNDGFRPARTLPPE